jgi:hypothetical protein
MQLAINTQMHFIYIQVTGTPISPIVARINRLGCPMRCLSGGFTVVQPYERLQSLGAQSMCHDVNFNISNMTSLCIVR